MTSAQTTWILSLKDQISRPLRDVRKSTDKALAGVRKIGAMNFYAVGQSIRELNSQVKALNEPFIEYEASLKELKAITNATDEQVKKMGEAAREAAKQFGTNAAQNVESYKLLLSQLSPEIAQNTDALAAMGNHVNILSKQLKGDTVAATEVLTTAMNQYGISLKDPMQASKKMAEMMNVMSAAAQEGSAELPQIKMALQQAGLTAKTQKVSFEELNAAIQVLDKAGKKGAEGGVALRNVMSSLSMGRFLPREAIKELESAGIDVSKLADKSLSLQERLTLLKPIINDNALLAKTFGKENQAAAIALIQNSDSMGTLTQKISGTQSATQQANIVMSSWKEQLQRVKTHIQDVAIAIGKYTTPFQPAIEVTSQLAMTASSMASIYSGLAPVFKTVGNAAKALAGRIKTLALSFLATPFGQITALVAGVGLAVYKVTQYVKKQREAVLHNSRAWIQQQAALRVHKDLQNSVIEATSGRIAKIKVLTDIAANETLSLSARKKALLELIDIDDRYKDALDGDIIKTDILKKSTKELREEYIKNARAAGRMQQLQEKSIELDKNEQALEPIRKEIRQHKQNLIRFNNDLKNATDSRPIETINYLRKNEIDSIKELESNPLFAENKMLKAQIKNLGQGLAESYQEENKEKENPSAKQNVLPTNVQNNLSKLRDKANSLETQKTPVTKGETEGKTPVQEWEKTTPFLKKLLDINTALRRGDKPDWEKPLNPERQNITINFHINNADNAEEVSEKVLEKINEQLSDGMLKKEWG